MGGEEGNRAGRTCKIWSWYHSDAGHDVKSRGAIAVIRRLFKTSKNRLLNQCKFHHCSGEFWPLRIKKIQELTDDQTIHFENLIREDLTTQSNQYL